MNGNLNLYYSEGASFSSVYIASSLVDMRPGIPVPLWICIRNEGRLSMRCSLNHNNATRHLLP